MIKKMIFFSAIILFLISCNSVQKEFKSTINNYDKENVSNYLMDSCLLSDPTNFSMVNDMLKKVGYPPVNNLKEVEEMIKVIPIMNVDVKALEYDYSQNFLSYIREVKPEEWNKRIAFVMKDSVLVLEIHGLKMRDRPWESNGFYLPFKEGDSFTLKLLKDYPEGFFYCTALRAFCVVKDNELFICRRSLQQLQTVEEYFNSYYPIKDFKEDLVKYFN